MFHAFHLIAGGCLGIEAWHHLPQLVWAVAVLAEAAR